MSSFANMEVRIRSEKEFVGLNRDVGQKYSGLGAKLWSNYLRQQQAFLGH
jgi:hypothetical protein